MFKSSMLRYLMIVVLTLNRAKNDEDEEILFFKS